MHGRKRKRKKKKRLDEPTGCTELPRLRENFLQERTKRMPVCLEKERKQKNIGMKWASDAEFCNCRYTIGLCVFLLCHCVCYRSELEVVVKVLLASCEHLSLVLFFLAPMVLIKQQFRCSRANSVITPIKGSFQQDGADCNICTIFFIF